MAVVELPFQVRDRAAYFPEADALVLADLHLGKGEAAAVELPLTGRVVERVDALVERFEPGTVVLAGDVLHSFSRVTGAVVESFDDLRARLADVDLRLVAGNHDGSLESLCGGAGGATGDAGTTHGGADGDSVDGVDAGDGRDPPATVTGAVLDSYRLPDGTLVCHGHEEPAGDAPRHVIGHDHPAIRIEGKRRPCYLYGEGVYRGDDVLALPAFNPLATGTLVNRMGRHDPASPLLADVRTFRPIVRDEAAGETYVFPPLGSSGAFL